MPKGVYVRKVKPAIDITRIVARFEQKFICEPNTGCNLWIAGRNKQQRAIFRFEGRSQNASRVAYILYVGRPPPDKPHVLHTCLNSDSCVSQYHLYAGGDRENARDRVVMGRVRIKEAITASAIARRTRTHCRRGHPLLGDNLRMDKKGARVCRTCKRDYSRRPRI